ncbi:MAG: hypothetical protein AVDCRST_MAG15-3036 [uncultured Rubellimicrobium sp.]|uniref:Uncharacterized protein n=1 Tax=uncultured Rubellimicrobium sp. TaxID=543078 RepID=A0A6J4QC48_9RHOB|nr:MAG: hypothetical protein AVDCRST_MAG15-3036 [uncultured Rubellimicrobium sp.]
MEGTPLVNRLEEQVAGVCLIAGAVLLAPTTYFEYSEGRLFGAGALGLVLYALLVPGLLGVARSLRQGAPRLSVVVGLLATLGCVGGAVFQTALLHEWAARTAGTPEAMVAAIMAVTEGRVFPVLVIFGILFPIALLTLGVGLFRTGVAPTWLAALLGIGAIAWPVGHIGSMQLVQHLADALVLVPLVWLGLRSLTNATPQGVAVPAATQAPPRNVRHTHS